MPAQRQGQTTRPTGTSLRQLPLAGKSVLIIEDEPLIAMSVQFCLQDAGAAVVKIAWHKALSTKAFHSMRRLSIYTWRMEMPAP
jgi:hypothetical protein